jgi:hypothetical protein
MSITSITVPPSITVPLASAQINGTNILIPHDALTNDDDKDSVNLKYAQLSRAAMRAPARGDFRADDPFGTPVGEPASASGAPGGIGEPASGEEAPVEVEGGGKLNLKKCASIYYRKHKKQFGSLSQVLKSRKFKKYYKTLGKKNRKSKKHNFSKRK